MRLVYPASPWEPAAGTTALLPRLARVRIGSGGSMGAGSVATASVAAPPSAALRARAALRNALVYWFEFARHLEEVDRDPA